MQFKEIPLLDCEFKLSVKTDILFQYSGGGGLILN